MAVENSFVPRVLVIAANPFSDINNNGKTLKNIFSSFPRECLYEFYTRPQDNLIGDGLFASSYYAVSEMDILRSFFKFSRKCGGTQTFDEHHDYDVANNRVYLHFLHGKLKNVRWLRDLLWKTRRWDNQEYQEWIQSCRPEIVFALLGNPGISYDIAQEIACKFDIPLVVYFTDDYLIHWPHNTVLERRRHRKEIKAYRQIVEQSYLRFCIGEIMCKEYSDFFGKDFYPIMNLITRKPYEWSVTTNIKPRLSYFGSLWLGRWEMLCRLSNLIQDAGEVYVYSGNEISDEIRRAFIHSNIVFQGPVLGKDYEDAIRCSDILLHVESDSQEYRNKTALSISTKIPDCLVSCKPILAYGPTEIASMRLLSDNDLGVVISSEELPSSAQSKALALISNPTLQEIYAKKGYDYAIEHFDKERVSLSIRDLLAAAVNNYKQSAR